jgi:hypothetical protein
MSDRMVHVSTSGGRATCAHRADGSALLIEGMGHDIPRPFYDTFVDAIRRNADRAHRS